ncbi:MAG TPA: DUF4126 family protein [Burkholderiales bacterium]|jgi:uncharacterized membrane protein|nr:DUF4126 family protein [Burkholderiales bacterium]
MTILLLAFFIGLLNGLRTFTPPAAIAWAAHLGWLKLEGTLALIGSVPAVAIFTLLAAAELVADKMPWIPNRTSIPGLIARIIMGKLAGACVAAAGGQSIWLGALCGAVGGIAGTFGGYQARTRSVKALNKPDIYVALVEDLICVAGCLWVVTRF